MANQVLKEQPSSLYKPPSCGKSSPDTDALERLRYSSILKEVQTPSETDAKVIMARDCLVRHGAISTSPEMALQDSVEWLERLCVEEQAKNVWKPGYELLGSIIHDDGRFLVEHDEGAKPVVVNPHGLEMKTEPLIKLRQRSNFRRMQTEDLLEPLRLEEGKPAYIDEPYKEMLRVLQAWNREVAPVEELGQGREELLDAIGKMVDLMVAKSQSPCVDIRGSLTESSQHLESVINKCWPETASFSNQNPFDILVIVVANFRIAKPGLDDELREEIIRLLWLKHFLDVQFDPKLKAEKYSIEASIDAAYRTGNRDEMEHWKSERNVCRNKRRAAPAERTIDSIKEARKNLRAKVLEEMQELVVQQAAQKEACVDLSRLSLDLIQARCEKASDELEHMLPGEMENAEIGQFVHSSKIASMLNLAHRSDNRVRKLAGLDQKDRRHRAQKMRERRENAGTFRMMDAVAEENRMAKRTADFVMGEVCAVESSLEAMLEAASLQYREYDAWLLGLGDEGPGDGGTDGERGDAG